MVTKSTSSGAAAPRRQKKSKANATVPGELAEISADAGEKKGEGLSARIVVGSNSGASTHPTG